MSFVEKIVGPDEDIIGIGRVHWIYTVKGFLWLAVMIAFGVFVDATAGRAFGAERWFFLMFSLMGLGLLLPYVLMMIATEIGLTSKRVIYKRGLIFTKVVESDLEEIKAVSVDNGYLGRFFGYGYLLLDARFVENTNLPAMSNPYRYVKAMNEARSNLQENSMHVHVDVNDMKASVQGQISNAAEPHEGPAETEDEALPFYPKMDDERYDVRDKDDGDDSDTDEDAVDARADWGEKVSPDKGKRKMKKEPLGNDEEKPLETSKGAGEESHIVVFEEERDLEKKLRDEILDDFEESSEGDD